MAISYLSDSKVQINLIHSHIGLEYLIIDMTSIMLHLMLFKFRYNYHDSKMSFQNENFGMMDEAYFVPRTEILDWLHNLLHVSSS